MLHPAWVLLSICSLHFTLSLPFTPGPQSANHSLHFTLTRLYKKRKQRQSGLSTYADQSHIDSDKVKSVTYPEDGWSTSWKNFQMSESVTASEEFVTTMYKNLENPRIELRGHCWFNFCSEKQCKCHNRSSPLSRLCLDNGRRSAPIDSQRQISILFQNDKEITRASPSHLCIANMWPSVPHLMLWIRDGPFASVWERLNAHTQSFMSLNWRHVLIPIPSWKNKWRWM